MADNPFMSLPKADTDSADNPFMSLPKAVDDEGMIESIGRGIVTAPISLAQGIVELGAMGLDKSFDTNTLRSATDFFAGVKEGIEPTGEAGKITEEVVGFGLGFIPIAGWLGRANHVAKGGRALSSKSKFMKSAEAFGKSDVGKKLLSSRKGLYGSTAVATGVYEGLFSPDGRETLSDTFSVLPDALKTEAYSGETGSAEVSRQFKNKLRSAAEGAASSMGFDLALYGLGSGAREVAKIPVVNETLAAGAKGVVDAMDLVGRSASKVPGSKSAKRVFDKYFTATKGADPAVVAAIQDVQGLSKAEKNRAIKLVTGFDNSLKAAVKTMKGQNGTKAAMKEAEADSYNFLTGGVKEEFISSKYGPKVLKDLNNIVEQSTELEDLLARQLQELSRSEANRLSGPTAQASFAPGAPVTNRGTAAAEALNQIKKLQETRRAHLSRMFEVHQNPIKFYQELDENFMDQKPFQDAVEKLMLYSAAGNPQAFGSAASRENAEKLILDIVDLGDIRQGVAPKEAIAARLNQVKEELGDMGGLTTERQPLFRLADEMLITRKELITDVPAVRAFMGEITDPRALAINTLNKMAESTVAYDFYRNIMGKQGQSAGEALPKIRSGARPTVIDIPNPATMSPDEYATEIERLAANGATPDNVGSILRRNGYKQLGEFNPDSAFGGQYGDLSGRYVPAEVYDNLTAPVTLSSHPASQLASIVNQIKGLSQKQLIVPNVSSRVRDFLGNQLMRVATGNAPSLYNQNYMEAAQVFLRNAANLDSKGMDRLKYKLDASGVTDSNILIKAVKQYQEEGASVGAAAAVRKGIERYENLPGVKQVMDFFESVTDGVDGYSKATVMMGEESKLNEVFRGAQITNPEEMTVALNWMQRNGLADRTQSEVLDFATAEGRPSVRLSPSEVIAADRTKAMMPNYNMIGTAVRNLDRALPFGNFTSFASENIRNMTNILDLGLKELSAAVDKDLLDELGKERAEALVRLTRAEGAQRLTGLLTVAVITPKAMVRAGMNATGTTDEQMERLYEQIPDYLAGHDIVPTDNDQKGKLEYIDLSYVSPYGFVTDAIQAGLRAYSETGRLDKSEAEQLASGTWSTIASLADPFASESIVFERVRDALPRDGFPGVGRGGVTSTGAKIYRDTDPRGEKIKRGLIHIMDGLAPAYLKLAGEGRKGEIEPGRLTRAMLNVPSARGQDYNTYEELARQVTGFTPMSLDLKRDFEFSGKEYAPRRSDAKTAANREIIRSDATPADMISSWESYLDNLYREQSNLYNDIQGARTLGLSDQEIRRNLIGKAGLGTKEVNVIMRGEFYPGAASREVFKSVAMQIKEGRTRLTSLKDLPMKSLNELSRARMKEPLNPGLYRDKQPSSQGNPFMDLPKAGDVQTENPFMSLPKAGDVQGSLPQVQNRAAFAAPATAPMPMPAVPQTPQASTRTSPPSAAFLGSNPVDQLRNAEIAQRTTGQ